MSTNPARQPDLRAGAREACTGMPGARETAEHPPEKRGALAWLLSLVAIAFVALALPACSPSGPALSDLQPSTNVMVPGSSGIGKPPGAIEVRYTLGRAEQVTVRLQGSTGADLLSEQQEAGEHTFRFNGVIAADTTIDGYKQVRQALPAGDYTLAISAGGTTKSVGFKVSESAARPPSIANLLVHPDTISPNSDAVDDVAEVTFRTEQTSTLSVDLTGPDGVDTPVLAPVQKGPGEQNVVVNGMSLQGTILPDGSYTLTVRAQDQAGNRIETNRPLRIQGGGEPGISVLKVEINPQQIMLGQAITVSVTVKNTGKVPLRTQGPNAGYTYNTNDSYSSIEGGKYVDRAGLWRVGVDWDGNSGGAGPYRYPFRWGFGHTLMPGEIATTGGRIVIMKQEKRMWFYAGVLQEGIRIVLDRLGRAPVDVSF